jgi:hypothetical protein
MYLIKETKEDPRKLEFVSLSLIFHLRIEQRCSLVFFPCQSTGCASTATPSSTSSRRIRLSKTTFSRYVIYLLSLPSVENAADRSSRSSLFIQTIFLNSKHKDTWSIDEIKPEKIIRKDW